MSQLVDSLTSQRDGLITQMTSIAQMAVNENRSMSADESTRFDQITIDVESIDKRLLALREQESRARDIEASFHRDNPQARNGGEPEAESAFGTFLRNARIGEGYDLAPVAGAERRALARFRGGEEQRAVSATGGVSADSVYGQLWEYAIAASQLLQAGVEIINTEDGNTIPFPRATVHATATTGAANTAATSSDPTFDTVQNTVVKKNWLTLVPTELIQDATFDVEGYLARRAGIELARQIASVATTAYIAGYTVAGATGPVGTTLGLGNQSTVGQGSDLLVDLFHSVLPEYRSSAAWTLADPTAAIVRKLKTSTGEPVWQPALTAGDPDLILGKPVFIDPFLPSPGVSAKSIYFGDWSSLIIRIAGGMRFERSAEFAFDKDQIAFRGVVRTGSSVLDPNAVKYFVHSAT
jgi:HK97 family phage major capsid protein